MDQKIHILAVTYGHDIELKCFINSILCQTNPNWTMLIVHDGPNEKLEEDLLRKGYLDDQRITFICSPKRRKTHGHVLRQTYMKEMPDDGYLLLTNGDNYYVPTFVDTVLNSIGFDDISLIYWDFKSHQTQYLTRPCQLLFSKIDMGAAVVKSSLAKKVGFSSLDYAADWIYFRSVLNSPDFVQSRKIEGMMFIHN